jgi:hypothetical protein
MEIRPSLELVTAKPRVAAMEEETSLEEGMDKIPLKALVPVVMAARTQPKAALVGMVARTRPKAALVGMVARIRPKTALVGMAARTRPRTTLVGMAARTRPRTALVGMETSRAGMARV